MLPNAQIRYGSIQQYNPTVMHSLMGSQPVLWIQVVKLNAFLFYTSIGSEDGLVPGELLCFEWKQNSLDHP